MNGSLCVAIVEKEDMTTNIARGDTVRIVGQELTSTFNAVLVQEEMQHNHKPTLQCLMQEA
jgi:hypothetical protein